MRQREVEVAGIRDNSLIVFSGLQPGEHVASAGVSFLRDGQEVNLLTPQRKTEPMVLQTRFGLQKSRLTVLVMIGLLLLGYMSYTGLPKREDPAVTIRTAIVVAQFPGMTPERVEELIAEPLERTARAIPEVDEITTLITTGQAELSVTILDAIPSADLDRVFQDIRNEMMDAGALLPDGTRGPFVNTSFGDVSIATIAVTGEGFSYEEMWDAAEDLQSQIYTLDGITRVTIDGRRPRHPESRART